MNYITFINPPESTKRKAQACMPPKANRSFKERFKATHKAIIHELD
jgi:hypothetical protein